MTSHTSPRFPPPGADVPGAPPPLRREGALAGTTTDMPADEGTGPLPTIRFWNSRLAATTLTSLVAVAVVVAARRAARRGQRDGSIHR
ncbi:hypothetical protein JK364_29260 [Streptomyces sp. 110]|uniref:Uncharacterized protein n=1 Tax=Streptomyces endocoffeicus TaxID=2898945 RepID=A0ABS1PVI7_9ACTN|nr:hypothetical protein [Streptomyces endocoffeicus]MBL1116450.1 hypothetical protein [Streptomyces endocoffeicus]